MRSDSADVAAVGRKRVLILQGEIPHYRKPVFNALATRHQVTVLHTGQPSVTVEDRYEERIVPLRRFGPFRLVRGVQGQVAKHDATIAMFDLRWPSYLLPLRSRRRSTRWILWGHGYGRSRLGNLLRDWLLRRADAALLYAADGARDMERRGIDPAKLFVAENTVDVPNHGDFSGEPKRILLFVGRLLDAKKVDLLIDAFRKALGRIPPHVRLEIVGDGESRDALLAQVRTGGLGKRVRFHGTVHDNARLAQLFRCAYAYVAPGYIGLSVLHSFAYGVPVIVASSVRHPPEFHNVVDGQNGLVYGDDTELEQALVDICTQPLLSARLGRNAYELYANGRSLDTMVDGFYRALEGA